MDKIENLKQIIGLLNDLDIQGNSSTNESNIYKDYINKKVIIRSNNAGVFFGTLSAVHGNSVELLNMRRIHYWSGANSITDIALGGIQNKESSRVTDFIEKAIISEVIEIIICTQRSIKDLEEFPVWTLIDK